ncbi:Hypothetical_protein [Hexamita inflata]|uniref:Hypothetical_protein n=1 Tax=Hexamita inflata TaxID=28002 RepID=A0AA86N669_9EUKA|nr:Hypothetical protein HINF_LOCUS904 [Hexamita inflata]
MKNQRYRGVVISFHARNDLNVLIIHLSFIMQFFSALASLVILFQLQKCLSQKFFIKLVKKLTQNLTKNEPDMVKFSPDLPKNQENWGIPSSYLQLLGVYQNLPVVLPVTFAGKCQALQ